MTRRRADGDGELELDFFGSTLSSRFKACKRCNSNVARLKVMSKRHFDENQTCTKKHDEYVRPKRIKLTISKSQLDTIYEHSKEDSAEEIKTTCDPGIDQNRLTVSCLLAPSVSNNIPLKLVKEQRAENSDMWKRLNSLMISSPV